MNFSRRAALRQPRRILTHAQNADAHGFFGLLTGQKLMVDLD